MDGLAQVRYASLSQVDCAHLDQEKEVGILRSRSRTVTLLDVVAIEVDSLQEFKHRSVFEFSKSWRCKPVERFWFCWLDRIR